LVEPLGIDGPGGVEPEVNGVDDGEQCTHDNPRTPRAADHQERYSAIQLRIPQILLSLGSVVLAFEVQVWSPTSRAYFFSDTLIIRNLYAIYKYISGNDIEIFTQIYCSGS
jgi:hypothetical protein